MTFIQRNFQISTGKTFNQNFVIYVKQQFVQRNFIIKVHFKLAYY